MKNRHNEKSAAAFTLVEMLVVIGIIATLAGLITAGGLHAMQKGKIHRVQSELMNIKTAIEAYKGRKGFYPPDNFINGTNLNPTTNGLYYELKGAILTNKDDGTPGGYVTLDGQDRIALKVVSNQFGMGRDGGGTPLNATEKGVGGIVNSSATTNRNDDNFNVDDFLKGVSPNQAKVYGLNGVKLLQADSDVPWNYNSSNPTNNPGSYDLWADIMLGGKTNRICNWSDRPIVYGK